jgi:ferredoxin/flavodoxin---NADP+ reductase
MLEIAGLNSLEPGGLLGMGAPSVAIVGAGPSGFFVAVRLKRLLQGILVDLVDRNLVPYGLVRYGVAPDHPEVKVGRAS